MDITKLNGLQFSITGAAGEDGTYPEIRFYIDGNEAKDCIFHNTRLDNVDKLIAKIPEDDFERLVKVLIMKIQDAGEFDLAIHEMAKSSEPQYVIISDMESYQEVCEFFIDIREFI